jgi:hypothetical protein
MRLRRSGRPPAPATPTESTPAGRDLVPSDEDILFASVHELVTSFREALTALVAPADRILLAWGRDGYESPTWDRVVECVYDAFVRVNIRNNIHRVPDELPVPQFSIDVPDYSSHSWIGFIDDEGVPHALVRFESGADPFDAVHLAVLDAESLLAIDRIALPWSAVRFSYCRRTPGSEAVSVDEVEVHD